MQAGRGLSYSLRLKACVTGLVTRPEPCRTSATGLTLHGWWVAEFQKHAFWGRGPNRYCKNLVARFSFEGGHRPSLSRAGRGKCVGLNVMASARSSPAIDKPKAWVANDSVRKAQGVARVGFVTYQLWDLLVALKWTS